MTPWIDFIFYGTFNFLEHPTVYPYSHPGHQAPSSPDMPTTHRCTGGHCEVNLDIGVISLLISNFFLASYTFRFEK